MSPVSFGLAWVLSSAPTSRMVHSGSRRFTPQLLWVVEFIGVRERSLRRR